MELGGQRLDLAYRGENHLSGNIFIYAPQQRVLMLVDIVYPRYMPYPNLGVATNVPGYFEAHRQALSYDFETFVGDHVGRLGKRKDVEESLEFVLDLNQTVPHVLSEKSFPTYLRSVAHPPGEST